jgi:hypothetical protein
MPRFTPRAVHVRFVVGKVALRQVFVPSIRSSFVIIILPFLHIHSSVIRRTNNEPIRGHGSAETLSLSAQGI